MSTYRPPHKRRGQSREGSKQNNTEGKQLQKYFK